MHWPLQHVAAAVGQHRLAERPGLERHHRQALEVRRHDQQFGGGEGVELVLVARRSRGDESADAAGIGSTGVPIEHEVQPAGRDLAVALAEVEQLGAALVLVDAADVDRRTGRAMPDCCRKRVGVASRRHLRADADDHAGHVVVAGHRLEQRALLGRVVHAARGRRGGSAGRSPARAPRRARRSGTRIALSRHRPRAVIRVVVAQAEEQEEVVVACVLRRCSRISAGLVGPSASSQASSSLSECVCVEDALRPARRSRAGSRVVRDRKPAHGDAVHRLVARRVARWPTRCSRGRRWSAPRPRRGAARCSAM